MKLLTLKAAAIELGVSYSTMKVIVRESALRRFTLPGCKRKLVAADDLPGLGTEVGSVDKTTSNEIRPFPAPSKRRPERAKAAKSAEKVHYYQRFGSGLNG